MICVSIVVLFLYETILLKTQMTLGAFIAKKQKSVDDEAQSKSEQSTVDQSDDFQQKLRIEESMRVFDLF